MRPGPPGPGAAQLSVRLADLPRLLTVTLRGGPGEQGSSGRPEPCALKEAGAGRARTEAARGRDGPVRPSSTTYLHWPLWDPLPGAGTHLPEEGGRRVGERGRGSGCSQGQRKGCPLVRPPPQAWPKGSRQDTEARRPQPGQLPCVLWDWGGAASAQLGADQLGPSAQQEAWTPQRAGPPAPAGHGPGARLTLAKKPGSQRSAANRAGGLIRARRQREGLFCIPPAQLPAPWRAWLPFHPRPCSQQGSRRGEGGLDPRLQTHLPPTLALPARSSAAGFPGRKRLRPGEATPRGGQRQLTPDTLPWGEEDRASVFLPGGSW